MSVPFYSPHVTLPAGTLLDFYIVQDATSAQYLSGVMPPNGNYLSDGNFEPQQPQNGRPNVFFINTPANADGFQHFAFDPTTGNYGVEDVYGGGDEDFNDVVFSISSATADLPPHFITTPPLTPSVTDLSIEPSSITLDATIRDFHPQLPSSFQGSGVETGVVTGIVGSTLGTSGKPVIANTQQATQAQIDPATFSQWYTDVPGVNMRTVVPLTFNRVGNVYQFNSGQTFFPINGKLFGDENSNSTGAVNGNFTAEIHSSFAYEPGQYFDFSGDDDVWVYIDNKLAIDLGGLHTGGSDNLNLDSLGLTPGQNYKMDMFYAERYIGTSNFFATTNIPFSNSQSYTYNSQATDPDPGDTAHLIYSIVNAPSGATINPTTGELDWLPGGSGSFPFTIKVTDPQGLSDTQSWNVTIAGDISDQPPAVNPSGLAPQSKTSVGRLYEQMIDDNFTDPDGDALHFSTVGTWPAGMTLSDTGDIEWTPTAAEITDTSGTGANPYHLTVQANDDRGGIANYSFDVSVGYYKPDAAYAISVTGVEVGEGGGVRIVWANDPNTDVIGYNVYRVDPGSTTPQLLNLTPIPRVLGVSPSFLDTTPILAEQSATYYITALSDTDGHSFESDPSNVLTWTVNGPLTVAQAATATPNPVTGTTTQLSVLGDENGSDSGLNYNWSMLSGPAPVTFSDAENDNSAKNEVVTFTNAGSYQFQVTVTDINNQSVTSEIAVTVQQTPTSISISPTAVTLPPSTTAQTSVQQFTAYVFDQFGNTMSDPLTWSCNGDGSIDSSTGLYTAPESGNGATITVSADGLSAQAEVTIGTPGPITAQVTSTADINLTWDFDANADSYIIYRSTNPNFIADGSNAITATSNGLGHYTDDDLAPGTTYYYEIDEVASDGVSSSVVGRTSATTFAQDTPLVGEVEESNNTNSAAPVTNAHFVNPSPTNVMARGVNDTTVYVAWQNHALNATHNIVQESDGNGGWFQVASTAENVHGCMIRNLQAGGQYSFRVIAANAYSPNGMYSTSTPSAPSQPVSPIVPTFDNMIYLIGGHLQTEADLEGSVDGDAALGVGVIFWDLVASGYNPYLTAEASGSGPLENLLGWNWGGVINWDGSGEAERDIGNEWLNGQTTSGNNISSVGLIGYSHGASIAEQLSSRLLPEESVSDADQVVFGGTIDSVIRYQNDWPIGQVSGPDPISPADENFGWAADAVNYYQDNPYPFAIGLGPVGSINVHGVQMNDIPYGDNHAVDHVGGGATGKAQSHVTIDRDITVLQGMQDAISSRWGIPVYNVNTNGNDSQGKPLTLDPWYYAGKLESPPTILKPGDCFALP